MILFYIISEVFSPENKHYLKNKFLKLIRHSYNGYTIHTLSTCIQGGISQWDMKEYELFKY